ncbi:HlyD family secretion protein [Paraburkholderia silvatlantica]|uniref:Membrane fusion protein (Multidrug efflux system) n=1 Tax=Paraburkholderia silvatlantica TaxID=321895 RepID=A0ABR6FQ64_9BURK|nr:HlyD family secretion protein [Paraburkholderia silvatlantica]MBB2929173.1 membrane fusion protein (multidrug efflux system) [Paraburkholderia silvatlantica]PVY27206.1 membrane fusion protein (multidrug efflux system) [Paraburkholderia silvatlantica]PXW34235.1 membrane fusion protein (multidrug efflux system) [Paraburkholderia silvatlantica]TDQ85130.1 membrane fusion protein (multidrug efflux system) [Paraburkholderia silvatlantica]
MSTTAGAPVRDVPDAAAAPARSGAKRTILILLALAALVGAAVWLGHWWVVGRFIESTDDAYLQADSVTIAPKVSGYVTDVYVADNQAVKAGDPLVKLDARQYQVALDQARANVDARMADIGNAQAQIEQQRANVAQAQAQQEVAQVSLRHANDEVARYAPLAATGAETTERLAELKSERDKAQATLAADAAAVTSARSQISALNAQLSQARAQLEAARANAAQSQLDLDNTVVKSALAGRVGDRTVRVGQYVQPGTRMLTVVPVQRTYLTANFKETQIGRMRAGQPVELHVDALPGHTLHGVVDSFSPGTGAQFALLPPENATGNFTKIVQRVPVRIRLETGPQTRSVLLPGMSVTVDVDTRSAREDDRRIDQENHRG